MMYFGVFAPPEGNMRKRYNQYSIPEDDWPKLRKFSNLEIKIGNLTDDNFDKKKDKLIKVSTIHNLVVEIKLLEELSQFEAGSINKKNREILKNLKKEASILLSKIKQAPLYYSNHPMRFPKNEFLTDDLASLPAELKFYIFQYLDFKDLNSLKLTSKYLYNFFEESKVPFEFLRLTDHYALQLNKFRQKLNFEDLSEIYSKAKFQKVVAFFKKLAQHKQDEIISSKKLVTQCNQFNMPLKS